MLNKKVILLALIVLFSSNSAWAEGDGYTSHIFDKVLHGYYSCIRLGSKQRNISCKAKYIRVIGWEREGSDSVPTNISDVTVLTAVNGEIPESLDAPIEGEYGLSECLKAMNLVKSNPGKWDLMLGFQELDSGEDAVIHCEAINQSLMQQLYIEKPYLP